jgi:hypothetical protein
MALYTTAGLLAFVKQAARRPSSDVAMPDSQWYIYLSRGQREWLQVIGTVAPEANMTAPTLLTSADGGVTYTFGNDADSTPIMPLGHVELYDGPRGTLLRPGTYDDPGADYVIEGNIVRFPGNVVRPFASGLYARYVNAQPADIGASQEPLLKPVNARSLIGYRALILYGEESGDRDPTAWRNAETRIWAGNPAIGDYGILGMLRSQYRDQGMAAIAAPSDYWWRSPNFGR